MSKVLDQMADMAYEAWKDARDLEECHHDRVNELEKELKATQEDRDSFWDAYITERENLELAQTEIIRLNQQLQHNAMQQLDILEGGF
jgi:hypothetical protein